MRMEQIIGSTVGAISDPVARGDLDPYVFQIGSAHFHNNRVPHFTGTGITGAETVNLWELVNGVWVKSYDGEGNEVQLTATNSQESIVSEGVFGFTKTSGTGIVVSVSMP